MLYSAISATFMTIVPTEDDAIQSGKANQFLKKNHTVQ
jgi:hypothetical protein